jgi:hypothetical protein
MTERQRQLHPSGTATTRRQTPSSSTTEVSREETAPSPPFAPVGTENEPTILGFPAELPVVDEAERLADAAAPDDSGSDGEAQAEAGSEYSPATAETRSAGAPESAGRLVLLPHAEGVGGLLLVLAGVAAGVSLRLPWMKGGATGLALVGRAVDVLGSGVGELGGSGLWQPLAVVLSGGVLFLLGLVLFRPARTHRVVGVLALLVALAAAAGVLVLLADAYWTAAELDLGVWFAVAVPALGVLGAIKAMLTAPRVTVEPG